MAKKSKDTTEIGGPIDPGVINVPAPFVNRFQITVTPATTRISFGEKIGEWEAKYHSAITLTTQGAETFAKLILKLIEKNREMNLKKEKKKKKKSGK